MRHRTSPRRRAGRGRISTPGGGRRESARASPSTRARPSRVPTHCCVWSTTRSSSMFATQVGSTIRPWTPGKPADIEAAHQWLEFAAPWCTRSHNDSRESRRTGDTDLLAHDSLFVVEFTWPMLTANGRSYGVATRPPTMSSRRGGGMRGRRRGCRMQRVRGASEHEDKFLTRMSARSERTRRRNRKKIMAVPQISQQQKPRRRTPLSLPPSLVRPAGSVSPCADRAALWRSGRPAGRAAPGARAAAARGGRRAARPSPAGRVRAQSRSASCRGTIAADALRVERRAALEQHLGDIKAVPDGRDHQRRRAVGTDRRVGGRAVRQEQLDDLEVAAVGREAERRSRSVGRAPPRRRLPRAPEQ